MKVKLFRAMCFGVAVILICMAFASFAATDDASPPSVLTLTISNPMMTLDGVQKEIDPGRGTTPVIIDNRTLVPIRAIIEALGGSADWDNASSTVTLTYKGDVIKLTIGSTAASFNGRSDILDVAPQLINSRTMLPIRYIAESFKFNVEWLGDSETVKITLSEEKQTKVLVAYFSATGTTRAAAEKIASRVGGDLFEIEPKVPYSEADLNWNDSDSRASRENADDNARVEITGKIDNLAQYDCVFIGYPIWWDKAPKAVLTFLESGDFSSKAIAPFCTSGSSSITGSLGAIKALCPASDVKKGFRVSTNDEDLNNWIYTEVLNTMTTLEHETSSTAAPIVFMTKSITPEALVAIYEKLGFDASGKTAIKMSTGEPPASNYLRPELIGKLVQSVNGTIVECNTAYGGQRSSTAMHKQVAKDHGFYDIADVDIMDEDASVPISVTGGDNIRENYVGSHLANYDNMICLSHFKGHLMGGFGGAIKNMSIGVASSEGKCYIHSGGTSRTDAWHGVQDKFLECMAEATSSVIDYMDGKIIYINVMNRLSIDCDCDGNPAEPEMHDVGILASADPLALDQACVDLVYAQKDGEGKALVERIESRNGLHTLEHAEKIHLGSRNYRLVNIDV